MIQKHHAIERVYVSVSSIFDSTGYMQPTSITWTDGRTFPIEASGITVLRMPPIRLLYRHHPGPGETSVFERTDPLFPSRVGRWFVERSPAVPQ